MTNWSASVDLMATRRRPRPQPEPRPIACEPALDATEHRTPGGLTLVVARDRRSGPVEVRVRVPLGPAGWRNRGGADARWHAAAEVAGLAACAHRLGAVLDVGTGGQWLDVTGWSPAAALPSLLETLGATLAAVGEIAEAEPRGHHGPTGPEELMDDILRLRWAEQEPGAPDPPAAWLDVAAATVVLVGPLDRQATLRTAMSSLDPAGRRTSAPTWPMPAPSLTVVDSLDGDAPPGGPDQPYLHVLLAQPEDPAGLDDPARYLATAVLAGYPDSRLSRWCRAHELKVFDVAAARDRLGPHHRSLLRLRTPRDEATHALSAIRGELDTLGRQPPSPAELDRARAYCRAQLLSAFDSPAAVADALRNTVAGGRSVAWVLARPRLLEDPAPADVARAVTTLYAGVDHSVVTLGRAAENRVRTTLTEAGWAPGISDLPSRKT